MVARAAVLHAAALLLAAGCAAPQRSPAAPFLVTPLEGGGSVDAYDTDGDKRPDYFTYQGSDGRIVRIGYDTDGDSRADSFVNLDEVRAADCRHVVLILDGIGYETVEAFRREGRLRLFHPPARVISTFPAMTDTALADVFQSVPCAGLEAVHFDRRVNRIVGGDADYLSLKNGDWARRIDYRAGTLTDPLAYLYPNAIFRQELDDLRNLFDQRDRPRLVAYLVATAGIGTREGLAGQRKVLDAVDRFAAELVWKTRGLVKVTILSDHGHTLVPCRRIDFAKFLAEKGWRPADRLERPRDVACIEYGIVTYASFATRERADLARDLLQHPGVDLVTYAEGDAVVVEKAGAKALIERRGDRYRYRCVAGDPLDLGPIIEQAKSVAGGSRPPFDADDFAADRAWFGLTATHRYPDPLERLWRVFHGLVENVPDVIASLKDGSCAGSASRAGWLSTIASTHGDLERKSSTAMILSTAGPTRPEGREDAAWRSHDLRGVLEDLTGRPWPPSRGGDGK